MFYYETYHDGGFVYAVPEQLFEEEMTCDICGITDTLLGYYESVSDFYADYPDAKLA